VELCYPSIVDEVMKDTRDKVIRKENECIQATIVEANNHVKSEFDLWCHLELHLKQDEASARLTKWEQDRRKEQLCDFQRMWDSYPVPVIKPTLDAWLAT